LLGAPDTPETRGTVAGVRGRNASIDVGGVSKAFGSVPVLRDVSLVVEPGATVALLGPSGCGKTTLLRIIAGLEWPDRGQVRIDGQVLVDDAGTRVAPERRGVGMVFQDWALFPHLTVGDNVAYGLGRSPDRRSRVAEGLDLVGLGGLGDRMPGTLSGGQQQRVALARALAPRPRALLLDEPFSNLDTALRVQVRSEVHALLTSLGITSVFVTHDQEEAFVLGDEVAVMSAGRIVQQATPAELYRSPADRWIAHFVGEANLVPGEADGEKAVTPLGPVPLRLGHHGPVDVLLRPEHLDVTPGDAGTVEVIEFYGHDSVSLVRLDCGTLLRTRAAGPPPARRGDRVALRPTVDAAVAYAADRASASAPA
jgi:iron(III) transport system ATP-binding protein